MYISYIILDSTKQNSVPSLFSFSWLHSWYKWQRCSFIGRACSPHDSKLLTLPSPPLSVEAEVTVSVVVSHNPLRHKYDRKMKAFILCIVWQEERTELYETSRTNPPRWISCTLKDFKRETEREREGRALAVWLREPTVEQAWIVTQSECCRTD